MRHSENAALLLGKGRIGREKRKRQRSRRREQRFISV